MSEQWYCPNCGPDVKTTAHWLHENNVPRCDSCGCSDLKSHAPKFVTALQDKVILLEKVAEAAAIHFRMHYSGVSRANHVRSALRAAGYGEGV